MRCSQTNRNGQRCLKDAGWFHLHVYEPLKPVGRKRIREAVQYDTFRLEVEARANGLCEARFMVRESGGFVCEASKHAGTDPHHLWPEDRDYGLHDPDRAIWICRRAHDWIHAHPAEAHVLGLLRPSGDPERAA